MLHPLLANFEETIAVILFGIGFTMLLIQKNLIKKILGMNIMDTASYLFLAVKGYISGRMVPIMVDGIQDSSVYINPVPSGLVLTGIVVSVSSTALMLSLTIRLYDRYGSLNLDEILMRHKEEERKKEEEQWRKSHPESISPFEKKDNQENGMNSKKIEKERAGV
jgi:multicomponent Na+:H+ antiporter subunit C